MIFWSFAKNKKKKAAETHRPYRILSLFLLPTLNSSHFDVDFYMLNCLLRLDIRDGEIIQG